MEVIINEDNIIFQQKSKLCTVCRDEFVAIEGDQHGITVHCRQNQFKLSGTMTYMVQALSGLLIRCSQRVAVNPVYIRKIQCSKVWMKTGQEFAVSRRMGPAAVESYRRYLGIDTKQREADCIEEDERENPGEYEK